MIRVGEQIREIRIKRGYNQDQLAELANLNRVTVAKYETGKVEPGAQALARIADALEVTTDELLGRAEPDTSDGVAPKTIQAKILAPAIDQMPPDKREKALNLIKLMFDEYFHDERNNDYDDNA